MQLKGCAAIVTGGSGGLGQRICRALALNGVNVVVNYAESEAKAKSVAGNMAKLGVRAVALRADVTDPAAVMRMVEQARMEFGRIDILVNDAAFNKEVAFADLDGLTLELWNHIMEGTRMSANWSAAYAATAADRTLLHRTVDKDDVAEQLLTFCRSDSITGQTILMDSGRV